MAGRRERRERPGNGNRSDANCPIVLPKAYVTCHRNLQDESVEQQSHEYWLAIDHGSTNRESNWNMPLTSLRLHKSLPDNSGITVGGSPHLGRCVIRDPGHSSW
ncbi:unnamed protein product [Tuber aestivum]|uniref:Uncharacterized protein n=1 Tax=Tuber aestivum TaxID=59557 RepID=A0A292PKT6_9PEZI|nr:unnamed protein product [Tuber aestivum]